MLDKSLATRIIGWVQEKLEGTDLFLVEIKLLPNNTILILVDGDRGVAIEQCAAISRHVGFNLEKENLIGHSYHLEVSSPGVGTPLKLHRQYLKNIGRQVAVKTIGGDKKTGFLKEVKPESIVIAEDKKEKGKKIGETSLELLFEHIKETRVLISF